MHHRTLPPRTAPLPRRTPGLPAIRRVAGLSAAVLPAAGLLAAGFLAAGAAAQDLPPVCRDGERDLPLPGPADAVTVTVTAYDDLSLADVSLLVDLGQGFAPRPMADDGQHGDGAAGDSIFGARIDPQPFGTLVRYYTRATDGAGQTDVWPNGAPAEYRAYTVGHVPPQLQVSEVLAKNVAGIVDEFGGHEDWIEIRNAGPGSVDLDGMYLTDDFAAPHKWQFPGRVLAPGEILLIWADNEPQQGNRHATFKLAVEGESAGIFETEDHGNVLVHGFRFGRMSADVSVGYRWPGDTAPEYLAVPTPGTSNTARPLFSQVCINEFLTTSAFGGTDDWVELYNRGDAVVNIGGWLLSDDRVNNARWAFPAGTHLDPGEHLVVYEDALGFSWSSEGGEVIMLTAADSLTGMDFHDIGPQSADVSEGRLPDGLGRWQSLAEPTPGSANYAPGTGVDEGVRRAARILSSRPNPFADSTRLLLEAVGTGSCTLALHAADGRLVRTLPADHAAGGAQAFRWDGRDQAGRPLPAGAYFARTTSGDAAGIRLVIVR